MQKGSRVRWRQASTSLVKKQMILQSQQRLNITLLTKSNALRLKVSQSQEIPKLDKELKEEMLKSLE